jgi:hypothetical protein
MPYGIRRKKNCYSVYNKKTRKVFSKCSTKKNALKQSRLLRAIMFNKDFVPTSSSRKKMKKPLIRNFKKMKQRFTRKKRG